MMSAGRESIDWWASVRSRQMRGKCLNIDFPHEIFKFTHPWPCYDQHLAMAQTKLILTVSTQSTAQDL